MFPGDVTGAVHRDLVVTGMLVERLGRTSTRRRRRTVASDAAPGHRPHQQVASRRRRRRRRAARLQAASTAAAAAVRRVGRRQDVRLKRHLRRAGVHRPRNAADPRRAAGDRRRRVAERAVGDGRIAGRIAPLRGVVAAVGR